MGALENIPVDVPRTLFGELQRLLVSRNYLDFAAKIEPALGDAADANRDVYLLLLKDAFDMLGPESTSKEQETIDRLYDRYAGEEVALSAAPSIYKPPEPAASSKNSGEYVVQLKRIVQVTSYVHAGFDASDRFSMQRTVYRSP